MRKTLRRLFSSAARKAQVAAAASAGVVVAALADGHVTTAEWAQIAAAALAPFAVYFATNTPAE